jgi:hypothetical protein
MPVSLSEQIKTAQLAADTQLSTYFQQMSDSEKANFAGTNVATAINNIKAAKQDRFNYLSEDLKGADNNLTSTAYYIARTKDLKDMASDIDKVTMKQLSASDINSGIILRQGEINEWANDNKLDTLYFLQVLFLSLSFISLLMFLKSNGLISAYLMNLCTVLAAAFAVFVLITRARYTNVRRNPRYWNKMRFPREAGESSESAACPTAKVDEPEPAPPAAKPAICSADTLSETVDTLNSAWGIK